jgi:hypothetical protein
MKSYIATFLLLMTSICSGATSFDHHISYQHYFDSISDNQIIAPAFDNEGELNGILLVSHSGYSLTLINTEGDTLDNIESEFLINDVEMYYSSGNDTLFIFALTSLIDPDSHHFGCREPYAITKYIYAGSIAVDTAISPICHVPWWYDYDCVLEYFTGSIGLEQEIDTGEWLIVFHAKLTYCLSIVTMGIWTADVYTYTRYLPDLSQSVNRASVINRTYGYFDNTAAPGYGYYYSWYESVVDDPWNSYTIAGSAYGIKTNDSTIVQIESSKVPYQFAGDFIKDVGLDEFICFGNAEDLTGHYEKRTHSACYTFNDDGEPQLEWYGEFPGGFVPSIYLEKVNRIAGLQSGQVLLSVNCVSGQISDSIQLAWHGFYHTRFFKPDDERILRLFSTFEDTLFVFEFDVATGISNDDYYDDELMPPGFSLRQNYPNPFNRTTKITYSLHRRSDVKLSIFNLLGQEVYTCAFHNQDAGQHTIKWDGLDQNGHEVGSGIYLYLIRSGSFAEAKKMLLLK